MRLSEGGGPIAGCTKHEGGAAPCTQTAWSGQHGVQMCQVMLSIGTSLGYMQKGVVRHIESSQTSKVSFMRC